MEKTVVVITQVGVADAFDLAVSDLNFSFKETFSDECFPDSEVIIISQAKEFGLYVAIVYDFVSSRHICPNVVIVVVIDWHQLVTGFPVTESFVNA